MMFELKFALLLCVVTSNEAANLRDLAKRIYVGTCLGYSYMDDPNVHKMTGEQFNMVTPENEMKWDVCEPERGAYNYGYADIILSYAQQNNMKVRGHALIYDDHIPNWLNSLNKSSLHSAMVSRINGMVTRYKGKVYAWDVLNEIFDWEGALKKTIWSEHFGETFIHTAFHLARKADPSAKLYINDHSIEAIDSKSTAIYNLIKKLKSQGVPIDGVGFQSHFAVGDVPSDFEANLKRFTDLGVEVAITELDIALRGTPERQAEDFAKVYQVCQNVTKCVGVSVWGFTDKYSWIKDQKACMWDENFQPKPAVAAVQAVLI